MDSRKRKQILIIASIIAILLVAMGVTYAFFTYARGGTYTSKLVAGDIYMRYKEGSALNISNQMPSSTYPTKATNNYFQFQIIGKNTHSEGDIEYTLKLAYGDVPQGKTSANRIADQWLYFKLVEVSNLGEANETETAVVTDANWSSIPNQVLYTTTIPKNATNEITKTYRLYARISDSLTIGTGGNYEISTWNNLFGSIKINAEGEYVEASNVPVPQDASCFETEDGENDTVNIIGYDEVTCGTDVVIPATINNKNVFGIGGFEDKGITSVVFPTENDINIIWNAFENNNITTLYLPENVLEVGPEAFIGNQIKTLTINNSNILFLQNDGDPTFGFDLDEPTIYVNNFDSDELLYIYFSGEGYYDEDLDEWQEPIFNVVLGEGITAIYEGPFANNTTVASVTLPNSLRIIGNNAFYDNKYMTSITIPNGVTSIGEYAFSYTNITSINIPDSVTTIGAYAFASANLSSLVIPNSVTSIGSGAFFDVGSVVFSGKTCSQIASSANAYNFDCDTENVYDQNNQLCSFD